MRTIKPPIRTVEQLADGTLRVGLGENSVLFVNIRNKAETLRFKSLLPKNGPNQVRTDGYKIIWDKGEIQCQELLDLIFQEQ